MDDEHDEAHDDEAHDDETLDAAEAPAEGNITYEASEWSGQSRALLASLLTSNEIRHAWQGTTLVVEAEAEALVDELIDEVQASATAALDASADKIVYEVGAWSAALQTSLADSLAADDIPYEWDERGDLVIYADDEERVEEILDAMPDPDDGDLASEDGIEVQAALGQLWDAAGALAKRVDDPAAVVALADVAAAIEHLALPFGFEPAVWRQIVDRAGVLRELLASEEDDETTDAEISDRAAELHAQLRSFI